LNLTVYDHTGRIIDQIPPDATPAPFPVPPAPAEQGIREARVSAERAPDAREQSARAKQRSVAEPLDKTPTASSNTPSPQAEQGMSMAATCADQCGSAQHSSENALQQHGRSQDLRGSSTRACALAQNDTPKNPSGKPDPSAGPVLRTENREPRTAVQYPPGMGPRHLGPGPGGSLMAGTPSMPWWRRERPNKAT
jgi:hypothetical protein